MSRHSYEIRSEHGAPILTYDNETKARAELAKALNLTKRPMRLWRVTETHEDVT
jgi:hypothetical protein